MILIRKVLYICYHYITVMKSDRLMCCIGTMKCEDCINLIQN